MTTVEVITHYAEEDVNFLGDYVRVEVLVNGKVEADYGDAYHERGRERAQGFVAGVQAVLGEANVDVKFSQVADEII